jgi:hypothetical protein
LGRQTGSMARNGYSGDRKNALKRLLITSFRLWSDAHDNGSIDEKQDGILIENFCANAAIFNDTKPDDLKRNQAFELAEKAILDEATSPTYSRPR